VREDWVGHGSPRWTVHTVSYSQGAVCYVRQGRRVLWAVGAEVGGLRCWGATYAPWSSPLGGPCWTGEGSPVDVVHGCDGA
jgi:hypothetical protein